MRRIGSLSILALFLIGAVAATSLAARPMPAFQAHAGAGHVGGAITVTGKVIHAVRGTDFAASATVHFSNGDVTVALKRSGKSFKAGARVPVPAGAASGPVTVDVSITYGATLAVITTHTKVKPAS